ncbi:MAG: hypothetical protein ACREGI_04990 [Candidatus Levyibacteriota bacterium]
MSFLSFQKNPFNPSITLFTLSPFKTVSFAALPENYNQISGNVGTVSDGRVEKVRSFLTSYHAQLADYADLIVAKADAYGIDYRLVGAIGEQESGGCNKVIGDSNNCFGFGIHGGKVKKFDNVADGIDAVSQWLSTMKENGADTVETIGKIYNPTNKDNWIGKVDFFMSLQ